MTDHLTDYSDELPILTEVAGGPETPELPVLTEVVPEIPVADAPPDAVQEVAKPARQRPLNPEEMHQLLQQLEVYLETVFTGKLNNQLEQLQKLAVDLAVSEFKAELPHLLRDALTATDVNR